MADTDDIHHAATTLALLFVDLNSRKFERPVRDPDERGGGSSAGPRDPVPNWIISLDDELTRRLFELVRDACNHIDPRRTLVRNGRKLCEWVRWNASDVADLDFADDLLDEMRTQIHRLSEVLDPPPTARQVQHSDPYYTAHGIAQRLRRIGAEVPEPYLIRQWASRGHVDTRKRNDGRTLYRLADVLNRVKE